jgi:UDP-N-acetylmuramyl pentapeptide phosphotransferase/UDP-N-acetylglucosamine-1-phosphate transferase
MPAMLGGLGALSFAGTFLLIRLLLARFARLALDRPNARSLHERPVPRTGGIALLVGASAALAFGADALWLPLVLAAFLAVVSFVDDLRGMPTAVRLGAHLLAAGVLTWYVLSPVHPAQLALLALALAWITNLYNFMDGSDGLAAGMSVIGFATYGFAAHAGGDAALAALGVALAASSAAFLAFNFHPARIFLGDVGSIPLGFLAGALGIVGWRNDLWPLWFPVLVFGPFIGDATLTLLKRALRGARVWQPHREHYYQRLVRMGFGHRGTALMGYGAMAVCALAALAGRRQATWLQIAIFGGAAVLLAVLAVWVDLRWARQQRNAQAGKQA